MKTVGKFVGILVLVFLGLPTLIAATWVIGMTRTVFSDDFYPALSATVIENVPVMVEHAFKAARQGELDTEPELKPWMDAMVRAKTPLPKALKDAGVFLWVDKQVTAALLEVGKAMHGEVPPEGIYLDMRPLKAALTSDAMISYVTELTAGLPACYDEGIQSWKRWAHSRHEAWPPACNPGQEAVAKAREAIGVRLARIPEMEPLFDDANKIPPFDVARGVNTVVWLLFLVPLLLIAVGGGFAGTGGKGFLRWCGGTIITGGTISLLFAAMAGGWFVSLIQSDPTYWQTGQEAFWKTQAGQLFAQEVVVMLNDFMGDLFAPVVTLSIFVTAFGFVLVGLSLLIGKNQLSG